LNNKNLNLENENVQLKNELEDLKKKYEKVKKNLQLFANENKISSQVIKEIQNNNTKLMSEIQQLKMDKEFEKESNNNNNNQEIENNL